MIGIFKFLKGFYVENGLSLFSVALEGRTIGNVFEV